MASRFFLHQLFDRLLETELVSPAFTHHEVPFGSLHVPLIHTLLGVHMCQGPSTPYTEKKVIPSSIGEPYIM